MFIYLAGHVCFFLHICVCFCLHLCVNLHTHATYTHMNMLIIGRLNTYRNSESLLNGQIKAQTHVSHNKTFGNAGEETAGLSSMALLLYLGSLSCILFPNNSLLGYYYLSSSLQSEFEIYFVFILLIL